MEFVIEKQIDKNEWTKEWDQLDSSFKAAGTANFSQTSSVSWAVWFSTANCQESNQKGGKKSERISETDKEESYAGRISKLRIFTVKGKAANNCN